jgi:hypothetical protein
MPSLIADPELPYSELAGRLRALGWEWRSESQNMPTIPGEPERVSWAHEQPDALLTYTFNPVVQLRVLALSGPGADAHRSTLASFIPHLDADAIADLLISGNLSDDRSEDIEPILLGLFAVQELEMVALLPLVLLLQNHTDELVARVATQVARRLPRASAAQIHEGLIRQLDEQPDRAAGFALYAPAAIRRQVIRHAARGLLAAGDEGPGPELGDRRAALEFLAGAGLADPDWEVRASAMVLAGRHDLVALRRGVADVALPEDDRWGHSDADRRRLALLRDCVLGILAQMPVPDDPRARHALRCVKGEADGEFDAMFLLVHALTTPFDPGKGPDALPRHVVRTGAGYALRRSRLPVVWVAPLPCWLGDADIGDQNSSLINNIDGIDNLIKNPLRRVVPSTGFFVATQPLSQAMIQWILAGGKGADPGGSYHGEAGCSFERARQVVAALAEIEGASVDLPTADQWEIAARGPDGRRYPWGNGIEPMAGKRASPWGLERVVGGDPHWTRTVDSADTPVVCGGAAWRCDVRYHDAAGSGIVRPVIVAR